jgi:hypothetical protein
MAHPERENYYKQNFEVIVQGRAAMVLLVIHCAEVELLCEMVVIDQVALRYPDLDSSDLL